MMSEGTNAGKRVTDLSGHFGDGVVLGHDAVTAIVKFDTVDDLIECLWDGLELIED